MFSTEFVDAALDLRAEVAHETLDRPGSGVAQCADGAAFDLFAIGNVMLE